MEDRKKLYRSRQERIIAGVCGGIANYFQVDPVLIRLLFILLFFGAGSGLLAYIVAWIIVPESPRE
ncbi:MAG: PspC domain-containing protein [Bacillota bacterium]